MYNHVQLGYALPEVFVRAGVAVEGGDASAAGDFVCRVFCCILAPEAAMEYGAWV